LTPILRSNLNGGSPPAKMKTKSFGMDSVLLSSFINTSLSLISLTLELNSTFIFPLKVHVGEEYWQKSKARPAIQNLFRLFFDRFPILQRLLKL